MSITKDMTFTKGVTIINANNMNVITPYNSSDVNVTDLNVTKTKMTYVAEEVIGHGSFGVVYLARCLNTGELVAVKKTLQDKRFRNRELQLMHKIDHPNIVVMKHCFYSCGAAPDDLYLNIVMEFLPDTAFHFYRTFRDNNELIPLIYIKLIIYQLLRACAYLHSPKVNICHRDIKPHNLLIHPMTGIMKLCDFGSAKQLMNNEDNVSYICSRYYRAPELLFGSKRYSTSIDIWSVGCVLGELLLGRPLFAGETTVDQVVEIIKILGTPLASDIQRMNPDYSKFKLPQIPSQTWSSVFRFSFHTSPEATDIISRLLRYSQRISALDAMCHPFFDELRAQNTCLPNGKPIPSSLFNFTDVEKEYIPLSIFYKLSSHAN